MLSQKPWDHSHCISALQELAQGAAVPRQAVTSAAKSSSALSPVNSCMRSAGCACSPSSRRQVVASHTPLSGWPLQACREG